MPMDCFKCEVDGEWVSFQDCLSCADQRLLRIDQSGKARHCQFPRTYIAACIPNNSREHAGISATMVSSECPRQAMLERHCDFAAKPSQSQPSVKGTGLHDYFSRFVADGVLSEVRLGKVMPRSGRKITGQIDVYLRVPANAVTPEHGRIEDYKFKAEKALFTKAPLNYEAQQNIYRWMLVTGCCTVPDGEIIPPQEDITELVLYTSNHKDWGEVYCDIWPLERVEQFIEDKLDAFEGVNATNARFVPRGYMYPDRKTICTDYCHFYDRCVATGGEYRDFFAEAMMIS